MRGHRGFSTGVLASSQLELTAVSSKLFLYPTVSNIMRLPGQFLSFILILCASSLGAAATWGFEDATVSVSKKGAGVGGGFKEK